MSDEEAPIWRADLELNECFQSPFLKLLSADEKKRAQKFRFAKDSPNFIIARVILRSLIGK